MDIAGVWWLVPPQEIDTCSDRGDVSWLIFSIALASYLHDVFIIKFDGWVILGFVAQGFFTMRFVVQWIASETRAQERDAGGVLVFSRSAAACCCWSTRCTAGIRCSSPGRRLGLLVYIRNLYFIIVNGRQVSAGD